VRELARDHNVERQPLAIISVSAFAPTGPA
jgi:hypothetical protein